MSEERFQPEIGQLCFTNSPWNELPLDDVIESFLIDLGEQIEDRELANASPAENSGASYSNDVFVMRAYCWCDGELHPDGCPPNFEYKDFRAAWYKHAGRGASQNRALSPEEIEQMRAECLASLPTGTPGALARKEQSFKEGMRLCECGHFAWMHLSSGPCDGNPWEAEWREEGGISTTSLPNGESRPCSCQGFAGRENVE